MPHLFRQQDLSWLTAQPVAHRGYHDMNRTVYENTLSAFSRAVEAGFAIECDLHYTADSVPVIFHDDSLKRLCGLDTDVRTKTAGELALIAVGGTADKIPTLGALLRLVKGRVPIILELKGRKGDDEGFAAAVLEALEDYKGKVALMSFDQWLLRDLKALGSSFPLGLTAEGRTPEDLALHEAGMALGLDFISYFHGHLPNAFISHQRLLGRPVITWTVRDHKAMEHSFAEGDQITFEGFDPRESLTA